MTSQEFKQTRHDIGITQSDLAKIMGMTQPAIARIESGSRQPTKQQAAALRVIDQHKRLPGCSGNPT